jgi:hypothetical protein
MECNLLKKSLSPTTNNTNFFVNINDYSCSVILDIFRSSCTIYNKDFTILFALIFHCRTLDNIFACENIGAVMSRNETKICISQSLNSFGTFVVFFSSFDSNKIHTILTSLNTVITALCPVPCKSYSWCDRSNRIKVPVLLYPSVYTTNLFVQYWKQVGWDFIIPSQFKIQVRFILKIFCIPDWSRSFRHIRGVIWTCFRN